MKFVIKLLLSLLYSSQVWAAACCGSGFATPALITGDEKAQFTTSYSFSRISEDVGADQIWRKRAQPEKSESLRIEGAHIFSDRFQVGVSVPLIKRTMGEATSSGLGDVSTTLGYEYLPDWDYHPFRPRGVGYLQLTLPTGESIHEANDLYLLDARGRGFWAIGVGSVLSKTFGRWDAHTNFEVHRSFQKKFNNLQGEGTLHPGVGGSFSLGVGFSYREWRAGGSFSWFYEDGVDVSGPLHSKGTLQRYGAVTASLSYLFNDEWATTISYTDQSILGSPVNTSLGQTASLYLQRRWAR